MSSKINISVFVPSVGQNHEFIVPGEMTTDKVLSLIANLLAEEYQGISSNPSQLWLYDRSTLDVLDPSLTFRQLGVRNGSKLMLA
ncbi:hypothetical protein ACFFSY_03525 [Paenibacillus aurantiacus]|uniref:Ubiquitin-like domain-containing protein n=1 Tax=Paenibacillus aurantiacus TaxID=1936118 RepID=A0ABV5KJC0_9BACL